MDKEPLLPYISPREPPPPPPPPPLHPLSEDDEISLCHLRLTPSQAKDPSSTLIDSLTLTLTLTSPLPSTSSYEDPENQQSCSIDDPNDPSNKINLHRSENAPAISVIDDADHPSPPPPQFGSSSILPQAVVLSILYLTLGAVLYSFNRHNFKATETHPAVDALYFCIVTLCTIGYGDITPDSTVTKLFSIMFVLVGFGFIDILLSGMVNYVLDLQENYLLRTVKESYIIDVEKGRMRIRMKVALALGVVVVCVGIGVGVMHFVERLGWLDSFYFSVMSVTTVGYGDRAFTSLPGRIFALVWLLVSTLAVGRAFLYLAEARVDKRHRRMANWVLGQDMTVAQFLAADIDNNGFVSKSEYIVYKLKEMGKVSEKDIFLICNKFDLLDSSKCGKITLADLMESQHRDIANLDDPSTE